MNIQWDDSPFTLWRYLRWLYRFCRIAWQDYCETTGRILAGMFVAYLCFEGAMQFERLAWQNWYNWYRGNKSREK